MRALQHAPFGLVQGWLAGLGIAGLLVSGGCSPDDTQAPRDTRDPGPKIETAAAPTSGLVGEWKLDESGGTIANDTKNGYDATVFGGAAFVAGKLGNALNLNNGTAGTGGKYAEMPSNATLDNVQEGNYTISAWFYPYSIPPNTVVENKNWAIVNKQGLHMGLVYESGGTFAARHWITGDVLEWVHSAAYPVNAWYHVVSAVSKTAGTVKLYVNGNLEGTASFAPGTAAREYNAVPFKIGKGRVEWVADGKVDQVRIYNRELSSAEVSDLYGETIGTGVQPPAAFTIFELWNSTELQENAEPFNGSLGPNETPTILIDRIEAARQLEMTVILSLTGGRHNKYLSPCLESDCTSHNPDATQDSIFDLSKWTAVLNTFDTDPIKEAIAAAVSEGIVLGFIMVDEPHHFSWGGHTSTGGYFNKAKLDAMADQVHLIFPTLPVGVGQGGQHSWRAAERYTKLDFVMYQYSQFRNGKNVTAFRDSSLTQAGLDGVVPVLGVNLLDGGERIINCPTPQTGGKGTFGDGSTADWTGNCRMTAAQVRAAADTILKVNGSGRRAAGFSGWRYDTDMMRDYKPTFFDVRDMVNALPPRSYKRGS
jgi:concanavalin A-like lectin/glucanase superfamily protein